VAEVIPADAATLDNPAYLDHLDQLENQSVYIFREAFNKFKNLAMLWSVGKDSTVLLWLAARPSLAMSPSPSST